MSTVPTQDLSEYEKQRNKTVLENEAMLIELGLASGNICNSARASFNSKKRKADKPQPREPSRRSSRVRQVTATDVFIADEDATSGKVKLGGSDAKQAASSALAEVARAAATHPDELPFTIDDLTVVERRVFEVLRLARNTKAKAMERSMFIVCNDRTLCEMVRLIPTNLDELYDLYGMGEKKVLAHGQMLLDALTPHAQELSEDHDVARREVQALGLAAAAERTKGGAARAQGADRAVHVD